MGRKGRKQRRENSKVRMTEEGDHEDESQQRKDDHRVTAKKTKAMPKKMTKKKVLK